LDSTTTPCSFAAGFDDRAQQRAQLDGIKGVSQIPITFDPTAGTDYDVPIEDVARSIVGNQAARMASITIRNLEDSVKARLRVRAAQRGHSMGEEARQILRQALGEPADGGSFADLAEALFGGKGVELEPHAPVPPREPPDFGR
jgi:plasmid stability protein